ncbi:MNIO family bufferin maturase [Thalassotalea euphylliae]|uniref:MNIO family bufferin maturase n=1 Tax=Thalassotalea euphylliae TaxID=1655234 RepID=UPI001C6EB81A|nr:DUF692 domain-containing protein [Thalassotalea euphylliae]
MLKKFLGFGLGLRTNHYLDVIEQKPDVDWFEIISENYMVAGGKPRYYLDQIRENYPIVMHGVSMSVGSTDPLNKEYLTKLKTLIADVQPEWFSDHLCFTSVGGVNSHDLLPLPYTEESLKHVVSRIGQVQDFIGRQMLMENVSSYLTYKSDEMNEWQFYREVCEQADCKMLLDINNIYVSARNHDFDPMAYLRSLNPERVQQFHLAGHSDFGDYVVDTHDHDVPDPVWALYKEALKLFGPVSTMIERDANIPSFASLTAELNVAREIAEQCVPNIRAQIDV